jgi:CysZ protein
MENNMNMMMQSFGKSLNLMKQDKYILLFSLVPVIIGIALYAILGSWSFDVAYTWAMESIQSKIDSTGWLSFLSYIVGVFLSVIIFLVINWTFVIIVSLFACPFNDLISTRVENALLGKTPEPIGKSLSLMMSRWLGTLFNEIKKITFITIVTIISLIVSFTVPVIGAGLAAIFTALSLAFSFLDYSWSRKNLSLNECLTDLKTSIIPYGLSGGIFTVLIGMPIVNLFALPYGVIYYTVLHTKKHSDL